MTDTLASDNQITGVDSMDGVESKEILDIDIGTERELKDCRQKCVDLELELLRKNREFETLECKFKAMAVEKSATEEELRVLKEKYVELEKRINCFKIGQGVIKSQEGGVGKNVNIIAEEEEEKGKLLKKTTENNVLAWVKRRAKSVVEAYFKELESQVLELEGRDEESILVGKVQTEPGLSEMGMKEMTRVSDLKDGSSSPAFSPHLQEENVVTDSKETMHAADNKIITLLQSVEGTGDLHLSGNSQLAITCSRTLSDYSRLWW